MSRKPPSYTEKVSEWGLGILVMWSFFLRKGLCFLTVCPRGCTRINGFLTNLRNPHFRCYSPEGRMLMRETRWVTTDCKCSTQCQWRWMLQRGHTPLHLACRERSLSVATILLDHGADANTPDEAQHSKLRQLRALSKWSMPYVYMFRMVTPPYLWCRLIVWVAYVIPITCLPRRCSHMEQIWMYQMWWAQLPYSWFVYSDFVCYISCRDCCRMGWQYCTLPVVLEMLPCLSFCWQDELMRMQLIRSLFSSPVAAVITDFTCRTEGPRCTGPRNMAPRLVRCCQNGWTPLHHSIAISNWQGVHLLLKAGADVELPNKVWWVWIPCIALTVYDWSESFSLERQPLSSLLVKHENSARLKWYFCWSATEYVRTVFPVVHLH